MLSMKRSSAKGDASLPVCVIYSESVAPSERKGPPHSALCSLGEPICQEATACSRACIPAQAGFRTVWAARGLRGLRPGCPAVSSWGSEVLLGPGKAAPSATILEDFTISKGK